ncbi:uncharacterized protein ACNS7B_021246 isoform 1-T1 [Menidia menidia]
MSYKLASVLASALALAAWNYHFPKAPRADHKKVENVLKIQLLKQGEKGRNATEKVQPGARTGGFQLKNRANNVQRDRLPLPIFTILSTPMPLSTVFILLCVHVFRAVSALCVRVLSADGLVNLLLGVSTTLFYRRWKREKTELERTNSQLKAELHQKEKLNADANRTLAEVEAWLEKWAEELGLVAEDLETERAESRGKLLSLQRLVTSLRSEESVMVEDRNRAAENPEAAGRHENPDW